MNLYQAMVDAAAGHEEAVAFEAEGDRAMTHAALHEAVARTAGALVALGVAPGDRVVAQVEKSLGNVVLYLATLRCGAVFVPLNTGYTRAELAFFVDDAAPRCLVCDPGRVEALEDLAAVAQGRTTLLTLDSEGGGSLADAAAASAALPIVARAPADLAAILYTSGTTGRSKGAMLTHDNLYANAVALRALWGWRPDDLLLHALPIYHVHGLFVALHCALLEPSPVRFLRAFDAQRVVDGLRGARVYMGVPTHYTRLLSEPSFDRDATASVRLFISGSAPLLPDTFAQFEARTGQRILERYGMTEAGMIASNPLEGRREPGTVGHALPGVDARLRTPDGAPVGPGEVGVLEIRGPNVFAGYWQQPEKTRAEFRDGWFITGDLATIADDGRIAIVGRHKDLIISGGLNVYPREVEACIDELPGVVESAVIGVGHADFGEAVVAIVVADPDWPGEAASRSALRARLAPFKVPKRILRTEQLPRNAMGKVQKAALRATHSELFADGSSDA
ncbi:MAG: AMP-binding protein [Pseudomonadales bacterium]|jgi:malonyl-CoA/methylmalonyl-CoA synthetase|nr:AMP-binding protein [Pseudomonadales bacterium]